MSQLQQRLCMKKFCDLLDEGASACTIERVMVMLEETLGRSSSAAALATKNNKFADPKDPKEEEKETEGEGGDDEEVPSLVEKQSEDEEEEAGEDAGGNTKGTQIKNKDANKQHDTFGSLLPKQQFMVSVLATSHDDNGATPLHHLLGLNKGDNPHADDDDEIIQKENASIISVAELLMGALVEEEEKEEEVEEGGDKEGTEKGDTKKSMVAENISSNDEINKRRKAFAEFLASYPTDRDGETVLHYAARGGRAGLGAYVLDTLLLACTLLDTDIANNINEGEGDGATTASANNNNITNSATSKSRPPAVHAHAHAHAYAALVAEDATTGATPLHFAAKGGHVGFIRMLLGKATATAKAAALLCVGGGDDNDDVFHEQQQQQQRKLLTAADNGGMTPLLYAASAGSVECFCFIAKKLLLVKENGGGKDKKEGGETQSTCAGTGNNEKSGKKKEKEKEKEKEAVLDLIASEKDHDGTGLLHYGCVCGSERFVRWLLKVAATGTLDADVHVDTHVERADGEEDDDEEEDEALPTITKSFLARSSSSSSSSKKPNSNSNSNSSSFVVDSLGQTPLHFAVMGYGEAPLVALLMALTVVDDVNTDADANKKEEGGGGGSIRYAINASAQTKDKDGARMSALHYAAARGSEELMALLQLGRGKTEADDNNNNNKKREDKEEEEDEDAADFFSSFIPAPILAAARGNTCDPSLKNGDDMTANEIIKEVLAGRDDEDDDDDGEEDSGDDDDEKDECCGGHSGCGGNEGGESCSGGH